MDPKVEKAVRLMEEQKTKLKTIRDDAAKEARALLRGSIRAISRRSSRRSSRSVGRPSKRAWHYLPPSKNKSGMI